MEYSAENSANKRLQTTNAESSNNDQQSLLASNRKLVTKLPCLQYLTEFTGFEHEFDFVRAYEIQPSITTIEWLNRSTSVGAGNMCFVIANDKKVKLIKLRKEFVENFRRNESSGSSSYVRNDENNQME